MAPEQLWGRPLDARADQYAFAVALHEALYGVRPFAGVTIEELRWATSQRARPQIGRAADVPTSLAPVLARALSADPSQRWPTMRALLGAVRTAVDGTPLFHVRAHAAAQVAAGVVHLLLSIVLLVRMHTQPDPPPSSPSDGSGGPDGLLGIAAGGALVIYLLAMIGWLFLGAAWGPLNAYGLAQRKPWARVSTMVYGVFASLACCALPYGVYAIWAMTRAQVKELFVEAADKR
jgi:hypothetical protein